MIITCEQDYPFSVELSTKSDTWLHTSSDNSKKQLLLAPGLQVII